MSVTPAMKQFFEAKEKYPDCVILFRMGDFYETFYEDAKTASRELGITLTSRGTIAKIPLAGIPYHALNNYLHKLVNKGYKVAIETLNVGRIGIGAQMIGVARGALEATRRYVMEREQFGKPIGSFQAVQFQLAQAATELEAARLLVYNAARLRDARQPYTLEAAMAKLYSSQMAERVTSLCVDLFGGYGYTKEYPVEKYWRDAKIGAIYEGTSNMQLQTIGKMLLG